MLRKIELTNIRSYKGTVSIEFFRTTVIVGLNGSGKTSVIEALRCALTNEINRSLVHSPKLTRTDVQAKITVWFDDFSLTRTLICYSKNLSQRSLESIIRYEKYASQIIKSADKKLTSSKYAIRAVKKDNKKVKMFESGKLDDMEDDSSSFFDSVANTEQRCDETSNRKKVRLVPSESVQRGLNQNRDISNYSIETNDAFWDPEDPVILDGLVLNESILKNKAELLQSFRAPIRRSGSVSSKLGDAIDQTMLLLNTTPAHILNISICHQDDQFWPLLDLKKRLDAILNTSALSKLIDHLKSTKKQITHNIELKNLEFNHLNKSRKDLLDQRKDFELNQERLREAVSELKAVEEQISTLSAITFQDVESIESDLKIKTRELIALRSSLIANVPTKEELYEIVCSINRSIKKHQELYGNVPGIEKKLEIFSENLLEFLCAATLSHETVQSLFPDQNLNFMLHKLSDVSKVGCITQKDHRGESIRDENHLSCMTLEKTTQKSEIQHISRKNKTERVRGGVHSKGENAQTGAQNGDSTQKSEIQAISRKIDDEAISVRINSTSGNPVANSTLKKSRYKPDVVIHSPKIDVGTILDELSTTSFDSSTEDSAHLELIENLTVPSPNNSFSQKNPNQESSDLINTSIFNMSCPNDTDGIEEIDLGVLETGCYKKILDEDSNLYERYLRKLHEYISKNFKNFRYECTFYGSIVDIMNRYCDLNQKLRHIAQNFVNLMSVQKTGTSHELDKLLRSARSFIDKCEIPSRGLEVLQSDSYTYAQISGQSIRKHFFTDYIRIPGRNPVQEERDHNSDISESSCDSQLINNRKDVNVRNPNTIKAIICPSCCNLENHHILKFDHQLSTETSSESKLLNEFGSTSFDPQYEHDRLLKLSGQYFLQKNEAMLIKYLQYANITQKQLIVKDITDTVTELISTLDSESASENVRHLREEHGALERFKREGKSLQQQLNNIQVELKVTSADLERFCDAFSSVLQEVRDIFHETDMNHREFDETANDCRFIESLRNILDSGSVGVQKVITQQMGSLENPSETASSNIDSESNLISEPSLPVANNLPANSERYNENLNNMTIVSQNLAKALFVSTDRELSVELVKISENLRALLMRKKKGSDHLIQNKYLFNRLKDLLNSANSSQKHFKALWLKICDIIESNKCLSALFISISQSKPRGARVSGFVIKQSGVHYRKNAPSCQKTVTNLRTLVDINRNTDNSFFDSNNPLSHGVNTQRQKDFIKDKNLGETDQLHPINTDMQSIPDPAEAQRKNFNQNTPKRPLFDMNVGNIPNCSEKLPIKLNHVPPKYPKSNINIKPISDNAENRLVDLEQAIPQRPLSNMNMKNIASCTEEQFINLIEPTLDCDQNTYNPENFIQTDSSSLKTIRILTRVLESGFIRDWEEVANFYRRIRSEKLSVINQINRSAAHFKKIFFSNFDNIPLQEFLRHFDACKTLGKTVDASATSLEPKNTMSIDTKTNNESGQSKSRGTCNVSGETFLGFIVPNKSEQEFTDSSERQTYDASHVPDGAFFNTVKMITDPINNLYEMIDEEVESTLKSLEDEGRCMADILAKACHHKNTNTYSNEYPREPGNGTNVCNDHSREPGNGTYICNNDSREPGNGTNVCNDHSREPGNGTYICNNDSREPGNGTNICNDHSREPGNGTYICNNDSREPGNGTNICNDHSRELGNGTYIPANHLLVPQDGIYDSANHLLEPRNDVYTLYRNLTSQDITPSFEDHRIPAVPYINPENTTHNGICDVESENHEKMDKFLEGKRIESTDHKTLPDQQPTRLFCDIGLNYITNSESRAILDENIPGTNNPNPDYRLSSLLEPPKDLRKTNQYVLEYKRKALYQERNHDHIRTEIFAGDDSPRPDSSKLVLRTNTEDLHIDTKSTENVGKQCPDSSIGQNLEIILDSVTLSDFMQPVEHLHIDRLNSKIAKRERTLMYIHVIRKIYKNLLSKSKSSQKCYFCAQNLTTGNKKILSMRVEHVLNALPVVRRKMMDEISDLKLQSTELESFNKFVDSIQQAQSDIRMRVDSLISLIRELMVLNMFLRHTESLSFESTLSLALDVRLDTSEELQTTESSFFMSVEGMVRRAGILDRNAVQNYLKELRHCAFSDIEQKGLISGKFGATDLLYRNYLKDPEHRAFSDIEQKGLSSGTFGATESNRKIIGSSNISKITKTDENDRVNFRNKSNLKVSDRPDEILDLLQKFLETPELTHFSEKLAIIQFILLKHSKHGLPMKISALFEIQELWLENNSQDTQPLDCFTEFQTYAEKLREEEARLRVFIQNIIENIPQILSHSPHTCWNLLQMQSTERISQEKVTTVFDPEDIDANFNVFSNPLYNKAIIENLSKVCKEACKFVPDTHDLYNALPASGHETRVLGCISAIFESLPTFSFVLDRNLSGSFSQILNPLSDFAGLDGLSESTSTNLSPQVLLSIEFGIFTFITEYQPNLDRFTRDISRIEEIQLHIGRIKQLECKSQKLSSIVTHIQQINTVINEKLSKKTDIRFNLEKNLQSIERTNVRIEELMHLKNSSFSNYETLKNLTKCIRVDLDSLDAKEKAVLQTGREFVMARNAKLVNDYQPVLSEIPWPVNLLSRIFSAFMSQNFGLLKRNFPDGALYIPDQIFTNDWFDIFNTASERISKSIYTYDCSDIHNDTAEKIAKRIFENNRFDIHNGSAGKSAKRISENNHSDAYNDSAEKIAKRISENNRLDAYNDSAERIAESTRIDDASSTHINDISTRDGLLQAHIQRNNKIRQDCPNLKTIYYDPKIQDLTWSSNRNTGELLIYCTSFFNNLISFTAFLGQIICFDKKLPLETHLFFLYIDLNFIIDDFVSQLKFYSQGIISLVTSLLSHVNINKQHLQANLSRVTAYVQHQATVQKMHKMETDIASIDIQAIEQIRSARKKHEDEKQQLVEKKFTRLGEIKALETKKSSFCQKYFQTVREKFTKTNIELETYKLLLSDINKCLKEVERRIKDFCSDRINEINEVLKELWVSTYQGNDIDHIQIVTEITEKTLNYNLVIIKNGTQLDMKSRASAGQKVLACILFRIALCSVFNTCFRVLALDEPTTNLDQQNIEALACTINAVMQKTNLQFILITHDMRFAQMIHSHQDFCYYIDRDNVGNSIIEMRKTS